MMIITLLKLKAKEERDSNNESLELHMLSTKVKNVTNFKVSNSKVGKQL